MKPDHSFPQEICNWFLATGFQCHLSESENDFSSRIEISKNGPVLLILVLVRVGDWRSSGSLEKLQGCFEYVTSRRRNGDKCILLWEDYWLLKKEIVKSRMMALLGISQKIPGRLTQVRRIDKVTTSDFLETHHLNGTVSSKIRYGLFLPGRYFRVLKSDFKFDIESAELLVAVATFSYPRIFHHDDKAFKSYELIRFSSLLNTNVVGGLDKLLHAFIEEKQPGDIMTYADLEWSDGRSYAKLGFELRGRKQPEAFCLNLNTMRRSSKSRVQGQSSDCKQTLEDPEITIYNMGSLKYVRVIGE